MQNTTSFALQGGLNLVTPPASMPPGFVTAAINYEPDAAGYRRMDGYERFDGQPAPSEAATALDATARRALIEEVPGDGPVRGVWAYDESVWAFRDSVSGEGKMYRSSGAGWVEQSFGSIVYFATGTAAFLEGEVLVGSTSTATAQIDRVVIQTGAWGDGDATGYLVISDIDGTFQAEIATSDSGSATIDAPTEIALAAGGRYTFRNHNFYGAAKRPRMYFANGATYAHEWDGACLSPIFSGNNAGQLDEIIALLARNGDTIIARDGSTIVMRGQHDTPAWVGEFRNHLMLGYDAGSVIGSGIGEPLDYRAAAGAFELAFGEPITNFITASTAFIIFGRNRVDYLTGNDSSDFVMSSITDRSGAFAYTAQMAGEQPVYLDDAGLRRLGTTDAFGDWRMGTLTQLVEPIFDAKRRAGVAGTDAMRIRAKDQYLLFFDDQTGLFVYLGREAPEVMPFKLPFQPFCSCSGDVDQDQPERHFIGGEDGYVYEFGKGNSFDGAEIDAFLRFAWANIGAPAQDKRWHKVTFEMDAPDAITISLRHHVDYNIAGTVASDFVDYEVAAGSQTDIEIGDYDDIDWTVPGHARLEAHLDGIGRNLAVLLRAEHTEEAPHTLSAAILNFTPRRLHR